MISKQFILSPVFPMKQELESLYDSGILKIGEELDEEEEFERYYRGNTTLEGKYCNHDSNGKSVEDFYKSKEENKERFYN